MTEDDTFKKLCRATYEDANIVYRKATCNLVMWADGWEFKKLATPELEKIGWTWEEFVGQGRERNDRRRYV